MSDPHEDEDRLGDGRWWSASFARLVARKRWSDSEALELLVEVIESDLTGFPSGIGRGRRWLEILEDADPSEAHP